MLIKKFWKLYPSINRSGISSKRIKVTSKKKKEKKFEENILMVIDHMDMEDITIIKNSLDELLDH